MALSAYDKAAMRCHSCPCCGMGTYNYYSKTTDCRTCRAAKYNGDPCPVEPRTGHPAPAFLGWGDAT